MQNAIAAMDSRLRGNDGMSVDEISVTE
jgi:hypothetical protein